MQKILIADKSISVRSKIKNALGEFEYDFLEAKTDQETVDLAKNSQPNLIILDINMQDSDEESTLTKLNSNHQTDHIPVIAITSSKDVTLREKGFLDGASDFLVKPFLAKVVIKRVHDVLETTVKFRDSYTEKFIRSMIKYEECEDISDKMANKAKVICNKLAIDEEQKRDIILSSMLLSAAVKEKNSDRVIGFFKKMDFAKPILEIIEGAKNVSLSSQIVYTIFGYETGNELADINKSVLKAAKEAYDNFESIAETNDEKEYVLKQIVNELYRNKPEMENFLTLINTILTHHVVHHGGCYVSAAKNDDIYSLFFVPENGKIIKHCCDVIKIKEFMPYLEKITKTDRSFYVLHVVK